MRRHVGVWVVVLVALAASGLPAGAGAQSGGASHRLVYTTHVERQAAADGRPPTHPAVATAAADASNARVVSPPGVHAEMPTASPDGRWIVYTAYEGPQSWLYVIPAAGGEARLVAEDAASAAWSADGSMLGYVSGIGQERELVVVEVEHGTADVSFGRALLRMPVDGYAYRPSFSPSGDAVTFMVAPAGDPNHMELWLATIDGSTQRMLSPGLQPEATIHAQSWSPDGSWIAFLAAEPSGPSEPGMPHVHLVKPDGTGLRRLSTQTCNYDDSMAWEPYGRFLAVVPACSGIQLVSVDGTLINTVATEQVDRGANGVVFSPDGTTLYAGVQTRSDEHRLLEIPLNGAEVRTLQPAHPADGYWLELLGPLHRPSSPPPMPPAAPDEPEPERWYQPPGSPRRGDLTHACPRDRVPATAFRDVAEKTRMRLAIDCAVWWRLAAGQSRRQFAPAAGLTRGQLATLLSGVLEMGGEQSQGRADYFDDDNESVHEENINHLREAGVLHGQGRRFEPDRLVNREQVASQIVAAFELVTDRSLPESPGNRFDDDDGSVHEANINRAFDADLVRAVAPRQFAPAAAQRRDDAADSMVRIIDALVAMGRLYQPTYGEARVKRVVDGDTFIADVHRDNGAISKGVRIRMAGINAPERGTCGAAEATATLRHGLGQRRVRVSSKHASVGRYERPIRFVHVYVDGWIDISWEMLRLGHALWMPHRAEPARQRSFNRMAQRSAAAEIGIWDPRACGFGPQQDARLRVRVRPDPAGPDRKNLNGEIVRIRNVGSSTVRLAGWSLRNASLQPAYHFAEGTRVPPGATLKLHVGAGHDRALRKFWGARRPIFKNPNASGSRGDGAYLHDPHGDLRFHHIYPCLVDC